MFKTQKVALRLKGSYCCILCECHASFGLSQHIIKSFAMFYRLDFYVGIMLCTYVLSCILRKWLKLNSLFFLKQNIISSNQVINNYSYEVKNRHV